MHLLLVQPQEPRPQPVKAWPLLSSTQYSTLRQACSADLPVTLFTAQQLADVLCVQGLIQPLIPSGSEAAVFAVYNDRKQLQYVGFSKDLYNSLRTMVGRRPDKAYFYK